MTQEEYQTIKNYRDNDFKDAENSLELAIAAFVYTPFHIAKCAGIPNYANKKQLGLLKGQFIRLENNENKKK